MKKLNPAIRRELRIACSHHAQPVCFRIVKWMLILSGIRIFHNQGWFCWVLAGLAVAGMLLHFFYRWTTKIWTRQWGGWKDLSVGGG